MRIYIPLVVIVSLSGLVEVAIVLWAHEVAFIGIQIVLCSTLADLYWTQTLYCYHCYKVNLLCHTDL